MKRIPRSLLVVALALLPVGGLAAAAAADTEAHAASAGTEAPTAVAGLDDFTFKSFDADYYLDVDADGRSTLKTVETFVATFPPNQNRGMKRAIPESYQDVPTDLDVQSVTDGDGNPRDFSTETDDNGFLVVTTKEKDFVSGDQTYVFTYTQHNVTRFFANTNDDELYWDTVGTGWAQPFGTVTARFHVASGLAASLTGNNACYRGGEGSTDKCELRQSTDNDGTVFTASVDDVRPYENVTVALGFPPHTFTARDDSFFASPLGGLQLASVLVALAALVWALFLRATRLADGKGRPTIIAEYAPPEGLDVVTAAVILKRTTRAAAAEFVDLAVKRKIRIVETEKQGFFSRGTTYLLELVDGSGLDGPALSLAQALFGYSVTPGVGYLMSGKDVALSQQVRKIILAATAATTTSGLRKKTRTGLSLLASLLVLAGAVGTFYAGVTMLDDALGGAVPFLLFIPVAICVIAVFRLAFRPALSDKGAELRDHLKGLELFIKVAEADRIRMLQSPEGAERKPVSTSDPREMLAIYEKLLPYAVLFGLERQWAVELGKYYTDQSPDWYSGQGAFNAAVFASSIGSLSASASSSYSGSSSSSSSGGSGGGGSSGGGGGGGGGGGA